MTYGAQRPGSPSTHRHSHGRPSLPTATPFPQDFQTTVFADIPGLVEGAHLGVGLGHEFLRHCLRCRVLVHVLDGSSAGAEGPVGDFEAIQTELAAFSPLLAQKPQVVAVNKLDLPEARLAVAAVREHLGKRGVEVLAVSAATGQGVQELVRAVRRLLAEQPAPPPPQPLSERERLRPLANEAQEARDSDLSDFRIVRDGAQAAPPPGLLRACRSPASRVVPALRGAPSACADRREVLHRRGRGARALHADDQLGVLRERAALPVRPEEGARRREGRACAGVGRRGPESARAALRPGGRERGAQAGRLPPLPPQVGVWAALKAKGVKEGDPVVIGAPLAPSLHRLLRPCLRVRHRPAHHQAMPLLNRARGPAGAAPPPARLPRDGVGGRGGRGGAVRPVAQVHVGDRHARLAPLAALGGGPAAAGIRLESADGHQRSCRRALLWRCCTTCPATAAGGSAQPSSAAGRPRAEAETQRQRDCKPYGLLRIQAPHVSCAAPLPGTVLLKKLPEMKAPLFR